MQHDASGDGASPAGGEEVLEAQVLRTVYHDPSSRYTVMRVVVPDRLDPVTVVGRTSGPEDGAAIRVTGEWTRHPTHGEQFAAARVEVLAPTTRTGIARRLQRYPGIKEVMAERIVAAFGDQSLEILDKQPRRLLEVEGIGAKTLERILQYHTSRAGPLVAIEDRLVELDISPRFADAVHRAYGPAALEILAGQPYRLARDVRGIGFATADRLARALGIAADSVDRIDAGLLHCIERAQDDGHCALPRERLLADAIALLGLDDTRVDPGVARLLAQGELIEERAGEGQTLCFPRAFVLAEQNLARTLAELATAEHPRWELQALPDQLSEGQVRAVAAVAASGAVILTGGPGTGKSTVVRHVLELAAAHGVARMLAAPTGRAAKRLEQTTGEPASTVHRLLEIQGESGEFAYHANNPLPPGLVVVDESSMLDLELAEALITALTPKHRLLLVGDADQLPSVGPGNVLRDLIRVSEQRDSPIPVVRLDQIFRQAEGSSIIVNAHRVLAGQPLAPDEAGSSGQFFFTRTSDPERAHELIVQLVTERIPEVYGLDPMREVQVLCPMHRGHAGTDAFNRALQQRFTAAAPSLELAGIGAAPRRRFHVGDRVMQTRNDYVRNVFNGDIGVVRSVAPEDESLVVDIDGVAVMYERKDLVALRLAYAVTIHKSQGSEFEAVLIPLLTEHHVMLRRNLLYTAMTRARRLCVIVGDPRAVARAIARGDAAKRFTGLEGRVREAMRGRLGTLTYEASDDPP